MTQVYILDTIQTELIPLKEDISNNNETITNLKNIMMKANKKLESLNLLSDDDELEGFENQEDQEHNEDVKGDKQNATSFMAFPKTVNLQNESKLANGILFS